MSPTTVAISRPAVYEPPISVPNTALPFKLARHQQTFGRVTGIESRPISEISEVDMALRAVDALMQEQHLQKNKCVGLVVASSSLAMPLGGMLSAQEEDNGDFATLRAYWSGIDEVVAALDVYFNREIAPECVRGLNWGCSSFPKALELCCELAHQRDLHGDQYIALVTVNRLSQVMDWSEIPAAMFGDFATATAVLPKGSLDAARDVLHAHAGMTYVRGVASSCCAAESVVRPTFTDEGVHFERHSASVGLLSMTGEVIHNNASTLLAEASSRALDAVGLEPARIPHWVPHQAGQRIIHEFERRYEIDPNKVVRVYQNKGNLTASSIPEALWERWEELDEGVVACPSVGAGPPGTNSMTSGIVVLK